MSGRGSRPSEPQSAAARLSWFALKKRRRRLASVKRCDPENWQPDYRSPYGRYLPTPDQNCCRRKAPSLRDAHGPKPGDRITFKFDFQHENFLGGAFQPILWTYKKLRGAANPLGYSKIEIQASIFRRFSCEFRRRSPMQREAGGPLPHIQVQALTLRLPAPVGGGRSRRRVIRPRPIAL